MHREIPGHLDVRELQSSTPVTVACLPEVALCHWIAHCGLENSSGIMGMQGENIQTKTQVFFSLYLHRRSPATSQPPVSRVNLQGKPSPGLSPYFRILNVPLIQNLFKNDSICLHIVALKIMSLGGFFQRHSEALLRSV